MEETLITLPEKLFIAAPLVGLCNIDVAGTANYYAWKSISSSAHISIVTVVKYGSSNSCTLFLHMIGRWK